MTGQACFSRTIQALALGGIAATGCGFSSPAAYQCGPSNTPNWIACMTEKAQYREIDSSARKIVYEAPGLIRVLHGESCVQAPTADAGGGIGFRVKEQASVPFTIADSGTVYMNGWHLRYKNGDHHVQGLGSGLFNVTTTRGDGELVMNWEAGGVLTDQNGDDPYEWCYTYTVAFWSRRSTAFDAVVSQSGGAVQHDTPSDPGNGSALRTLSASAFNSYGPGVVLPQAFAMVLEDSDHHLLQTGFDFGQHYTPEPGKISWDSRTLLKDNAARRDYYAGELVATLSYSSPQSWHPESVERRTFKGWESVTNRLNLYPQSSSSFCTGIGDATRIEEYKIEYVPYEYAMPVLKGWELGYLCTDHHVREIGASIVDWHYERGKDDTYGTLYYTLSTHLGDDSGNLSYARTSVDVFGMNARGIGVHPLEVPAKLPDSARQ